MQHRPITPDVHGREGSLAGTDPSRHTGHEIPATPVDDAEWALAEQLRLDTARAAKDES